MTCPDIPLIPTCTIFSLFVGIIYLIRAKLPKTSTDLIHVFEVLMLSVFLAGALHLLFAAYCPDQLVKVHEVNGTSETRLHPPKIKVSIDGLHAADLFVGAVFLILLESYGIYTLFKKSKSHPSGT